MTRRVQQCITCPGKTRHRAVCASCRRRGVTVIGQEITVPSVLEPSRQMRILLAAPADIHAPTLAELNAGVDLTRYLTNTKTQETR